MFPYMHAFVLLVCLFGLILHNVLYSAGGRGGGGLDPPMHLLPTR